MGAAFLIIISVLAAGYALFTKQLKMAAGFLILGVAFVFSIPSLATGVRADIFGAITMILYAVGVLAVVFKKPTAVQTEVTKPSNQGGK